MNLVTDGMTAVALGLEPAEKGVMDRPPLPKREKVLDRHGMLMIFMLGGYIAIATLVIFHYYLASGSKEAAMTAQTVAFTCIIVLEKMNVFNYRSLQAPITVIGFLTNRWVLLAWVTTIGLQVCAVYVPFLQDALHTVPLQLTDWLFILAISVPIFLLTEIWKRFSWKRQYSAVI
jgi:Ca2+-transporting ATPase